MAAIRAQNLQITGGQIAEPPIADRAFQPNLTFTGRLKDPRQFEDIVVKAGSRRPHRAAARRGAGRTRRAGLHHQQLSCCRKSAVAMLVTQRPGSNALATAKNISDTMVQLKAELSQSGLDYNIGYNPTEFIAQSVSELIKTIYEAMIAGRHRRAGVPAGLASGDHSDHRDPGIAGRHLRRDGGAGILDQQSDPVRPRARGRHRGRRRDRGG